MNPLNQLIRKVHESEVAFKEAISRANVLAVLGRDSHRSGLQGVSARCPIGRVDKKTNTHPLVASFVG